MNDRDIGRERKKLRPVGGWILLEAEARHSRDGEQLELTLGGAGDGGPFLDTYAHARARA
jgi:hypothetical protein